MFWAVQITKQMLQVGQSAEDASLLVDAVAAAAPEYAKREVQQDQTPCLRISRYANMCEVRARLVAVAASVL